MRIHSRSSRTIFPGVRKNRNGNSISYTFKSKYHRTTVNTSTGRITETTRIPGTRVSITSSREAKPPRTHSPIVYKICGILALVVGFISVLVGLISLSAGGWMFILFGLLPLYFGYKYLEIAKQKRG